MKGRFDINKSVSMLAVAALALLLLLSPCKVRNFIQTELGVSQTQALNKSQSTISQYSCFAYEISESAETVSEASASTSYLLHIEPYSFEFSIDNHKDSTAPRSSVYSSVSDVPLYILYRNLKIYL